MYTQRMLDVATCRERYQIEYMRNLRRSGFSIWSPPTLKRLLAEMLYARDYSIALKKTKREVEALVSRAAQMWMVNVKKDMRFGPKQLTDLAAIELEGIGILKHYEEVNEKDYTELKFPKRKKKPIARHYIEHRLPSFEKKKQGGTSKHSFAFLLDRVTEKNGEYVLTVRHLTSNRDPREVRRELETRMDIFGNVWAATKLLRKQVAWVEFDVVRTKVPSEPHVLNCKTCGGKGIVATKIAWGDLDDCDKCNGTGIGGLSKRPCDTTLEIWKRKAQRLTHLDQGKVEADSEVLLNVLKERGETFAYRIKVPVEESQMDDWLKDTYEQIREIEAAKKRGTFPKNTSQCNSAGRRCPYTTYCYRGVALEKEPYFKKETDICSELVTWEKFREANQ